MLKDGALRSLFCVGMTVVAGLMASGPAMAGPLTAKGYIVVFKKGVDADTAAASVCKSHRLTASGIYRNALKGMYIEQGTLTKAKVAALLADPNVAYVEKDQIMTVTAQTTPTGINRADVEDAVNIDGSADNIDVDIAIIDTGILTSHSDLNVVAGARPFSFLGFSFVLPFLFNDDHGHGTHVGGTAAAKDNNSDVVGVAPGARLHAIKVLNSAGSGSYSKIIAGVDYVAGKTNVIEVANMSLGGGFSQALNDSVAGTVSAGVVMVVAAGNSGQNASGFSPASEPSACTVSALADSDGLPGGLGSSTQFGADDTFASFSNFGSLVDVCAPGVNILSTSFQGGTTILSGTSMAAPHVAGAAALYVSREGLTKTGAGVAAVIQAIKDSGFKDGDDEYFDGDPDAFAEPLLNVGGLTPLD